MRNLRTDVLGEPFTAETIDLEDDSEGEVVATLVKRAAESPTRRAVLYLHGFSDYFFHVHVAELFNELGYDFYALDLRKYGRSLLPTRPTVSARTCRTTTPSSTLRTPSSPSATATTAW
jgi:alpha-beta hydrolase superfamily lysophospholipase